MAEEVRKVIHIDTQGSQTSVKDLRDNVKKLQDALLGLDSASEEYKQIATQIYSTQQKLNQVMSAGKNAITPYERSLKALTDTYTNQRQELRALRTALENLDPASREYQVAFERAAEITHELQERQEMLRRSSSDLGAQLSNMQQIGTGIAAGFSSVNALMTLMGNDSENLQKQMVKLQAGMALVQGMKGLDGLTKGIKGYINGAAKWFDSIKNAISGNKQLATQVQTSTAAQEGLAVAEKKAATGAATETVALNTMKGAAITSTAALTALKAVLMSLGIGVVVAALGGLVSLISKIGKASKESEEGVNILAEAALDYEKEHQKAIEDTHDKRMELLRAEGASQEALWNEQRRFWGEQLNFLGSLGNKYDEVAQKAKNAFESKGLIRAKGNMKNYNFGFTEEDWVIIKTMEKRIKDFADNNKQEIASMDKEMRKAFDNIKEHGIRSYIELQAASAIFWKFNASERRKFSKEQNDALEQEQKVKAAEILKEAKDGIKSQTQLLREQEEEAIKIAGKTEADRQVIHQYYAKKRWDLIKSDVEERKKAADEAYNTAVKYNRSETDNLQAEWNDRIEKVKKVYKEGSDEYKKYVDEIDKEYKKRIAKSKYNTALAAFQNEEASQSAGSNRRRDYEYGLEKQEKLLNAVGLPSEEAVTARIKWIHEETLFFLKEQERWYKEASDNEEFDYDDRNVAYQKYIETHNKIAKENTDYEVQLAEQRIRALEREMQLIERKASQDLATSRASFDLSHTNGTTSAGAGLWNSFSGAKNASYKEMQDQFETEYKIQAEAYQKQKELQRSVAYDMTKTDEERLAAKKKIKELEIAEDNLIMQHQQVMADSFSEMWDTILDSTLSVADSFADVLGSIADTMESNIQHQKDAGEITEEEAEKQMEQVRAIQIAQAIINTLSGSIGAFTQASATIPPPAGQIVGAAAAAAVIAAGVAQIAQIKNTKKGSSNITSGLKAAAPALTDYTPDYQANLTGNSEMSQLRNALEGTEIRAYVVESDISTAQQRQHRRSAESTF